MFPREPGYFANHNPYVCDDPFSYEFTYDSSLGTYNVLLANVDAFLNAFAGALTTNRLLL